MHLYVELWKPREAWMALSTQERSSYLRQLGPAIGELLKAGVELIGQSLNDSETPHRADYRYIAVWKMSNEDAVKQFEQVVEQNHESHISDANQQISMLNLTAFNSS